MKVYSYDDETKVYTDWDDAFESPLEPGVYLCPAHATFIEPPVCDEGFLAVFNGDSWDTVEDKRGVYYKLENGRVYYIENTNPVFAPEGGVREAPPEIGPNQELAWNDGWEVIDLPPPPELSPTEKLEKLGLTTEDLKALLGL